ncbi:hypothetical protein J5N97_003564 [Dioscorea zingiberensis]|uniref:Uncharacterized protein n=1 Tax=Dioscorea zingiberensis TaxID=325984 RepID=A0A9D5D6U4_9LILI|nr:hypothetical protein J5N97_003564 [Dioscorea zingiberensis]
MILLEIWEKLPIVLALVEQESFQVPENSLNMVQIWSWRHCCCAVDLESESAAIGCSKKEKWLGIAKQFDTSSKGLGVVSATQKDLSLEFVLFPHVLLKNLMVQLQFSIEGGLIPEEGYKPWNSAPQDGNAMLGPSFSRPRDCQVVMLVGLPASGKTTWAENWVKHHPEKRCGSWNKSCFGSDEVVVFPTPHELKFHADKRFRKMRKEVPADTVNEMLGHLSIIKQRRSSKILD